MLKVGLTGNIGSGKSLIARIFETLQIPVFYADVEGKKILDTSSVVSDIQNIFGLEVIKNQKTDRKALAKIVFSDKLKLTKLNNIIHPAVRNKFNTWAKNYTGTPYILYEAAILHESGHYKYMDKTIVVTAPEKLRIKRVMKRDSILEEMVVERMANQWPQDIKVKLADWVINNNEEELLIPQVVKLHKKIIELNHLISK